VTVLAITHDGAARPVPPAPKADVYSKLARQLKQRLLPLPAPGLRTAPKSSNVPRSIPHALAHNGYSCEIASANGCSLHPCVRYVQSGSSPSPNLVLPAPAPNLVLPAPAPNLVLPAPAITSTPCGGGQKSLPRSVPIEAPVASAQPVPSP
jgi:hypothetical protein